MSVAALSSVAVLSSLSATLSSLAASSGFLSLSALSVLMHLHTIVLSSPRSPHASTWHALHYLSCEGRPMQVASLTCPPTLMRFPEFPPASLMTMTCFTRVLGIAHLQRQDD